MYVRKREASFKNCGIPKILSFPQHSRQVPTFSVLLSWKSAQGPILTVLLPYFNVWHRPWRRAVIPFRCISVLRIRVKVGKLRHLLVKVFLGWDSVPQNWRAIHDGLCIRFVWKAHAYDNTSRRQEVFQAKSEERLHEAGSGLTARGRCLCPQPPMVLQSYCRQTQRSQVSKSWYMTFIRFPEQTSGAPGLCSAVLPGSRGIFITLVCWHWVARSVLPSLKSFMASKQSVSSSCMAHLSAQARSYGTARSLLLPLKMVLFSAVSKPDLYLGIRWVSFIRKAFLDKDSKVEAEKLDLEGETECHIWLLLTASKGKKLTASKIGEDRSLSSKANCVRCPQKSFGTKCYDLL